MLNHIGWTDYPNYLNQPDYWQVPPIQYHIIHPRTGIGNLSGSRVGEVCGTAPRTAAETLEEAVAEARRRLKELDDLEVAQKAEREKLTELLKNFPPDEPEAPTAAVKET